MSYHKHHSNYKTGFPIKVSGVISLVCYRTLLSKIMSSEYVLMIYIESAS